MHAHEPPTQFSPNLQTNKTQNCIFIPISPLMRIPRKQRINRPYNHLSKVSLVKVGSYRSLCISPVWEIVIQRGIRSLLAILNVCYWGWGADARGRGGRDLCAGGWLGVY